MDNQARPQKAKKKPGEALIGFGVVILGLGIIFCIISGVNSGAPTWQAIMIAVIGAVLAVGGVAKRMLASR